MIRRMLVGLVTVLALAPSLVAVSATTAAASTGAFGCRVMPGTPVYQPNCHQSRGSSMYNVAFLVPDLWNAGYTFTWTIDGEYHELQGGCTTTSNICGMAVRGDQGDKEIVVNVTYTNGVDSGSGRSVAYLPSGN